MEFRGRYELSDTSGQIEHNLFVTRLEKAINQSSRCLCV
jgi:hypothetical protein